MRKECFDAVLPAAGCSVRFGENKLLYPIDQKPIINSNGI